MHRSPLFRQMMMAFSFLVVVVVCLRPEPSLLQGWGDEKSIKLQHSNRLQIDIFTNSFERLATFHSINTRAISSNVIMATFNQKFFGKNFPTFHGKIFYSKMKTRKVVLVKSYSLCFHTFPIHQQIILAIAQF